MKTPRLNTTPETRAVLAYAVAARDAGKSRDQIVATVAKSSGLIPARVKQIIDRFEVLA